MKTQLKMSNVRGNANAPAGTTPSTPMGPKTKIAIWCAGTAVVAVGGTLLISHLVGGGDDDPAPAAKAR